MYVSISKIRSYSSISFHANVPQKTPLMLKLSSL